MSLNVTTLVPPVIPVAQTEDDEYSASDGESKVPGREVPQDELNQPLIDLLKHAEGQETNNAANNLINAVVW